MELAFLFLLVGAFFIFRLNKKVKTLTKTVDDLERSVYILKNPDPREATDAAPTPQPASTAQREEAAAVPSEPLKEPEVPESPEVQIAAAEAAPEPVKTAEVSKEKLPEVPPMPTKPEAGFFDWFRKINLLVWVGGAALALGGIFIVNYSIEHGLLGPWARFILSASLGGVMLAVGEWLRRQPDAARNWIEWQKLPLATSAAGLMVLYGAVFSGYDYFELFPPLVALVLMAGIAFAGIAYSLLLGPLLMLLGMCGAYMVPMLISTGDASTLNLFSFLGAVLAGSMWMLRYRPWGWVALTNLIFAGLWTLAWTLFSGKFSEIMVVNLYLAFLLAIFTYYFRHPDEAENGAFDFFKHVMNRGANAFYMTASFLLVAAFYLVFSIDHDNKLQIILFLLALSPVGAWIAKGQKSHMGLPVIAHLAGLLMFLAWPTRAFDLPLSITEYGADEYSNFGLFVILSVLLALHYIVYGFWLILRRERELVGATHAVASPLLVFCIAYWQCNGFGTVPEWAMIALILAGLATGACGQLSKTLSRDSHVVGIFALGATAGVALALAVALENEWLSIAFAIEVAAIAWIYSKFANRAFRFVAALITAYVLIRLELNHEVLFALVGGESSPGWMYEGFLLPILAFAFAHWSFRKDREDYLVHILETALMLLSVTLLTLIIRSFFIDGGPERDFYKSSGFAFAEMALFAVTYLAQAVGVYWLSRRHKTVVREVGFVAYSILGGVALLSLVAGEWNPYLSRLNVGSGYILDWLFVAYLVPALLLAVWSWLMRDHVARGSKILGWISGLLAFLYLNMEIRHLFQGETIYINQSGTDAELYTYSAVWLVIGAGLLFLGAWRNALQITRAAFLLLMITVVKVFLVDMAALDGLWRAVSFLGLGAGLIGIGFLYQKYGRAGVNSDLPPDEAKEAEE